ncbi:FecR domain-containing protein [Pedobacter sp. PLR]|uniref:FecR family protein n=1 Tax=Pedobacter sp. PLR TaxID=2994465 RepID=UPI002245BE2C|nr:FecR family protein [Pedobacter sp. PLR]MCX2449784.1 FecR domain-containing protein [Pedobacter sp. PLR]
MKAKELLEKYRANQCTEEERIQLQNWFHQLDLEKETGLTLDELDRIEAQSWETIHQETHPKKIKLWPSIAAAAVLLIGVGIGYYVNQQQDHSEKVKIAFQDILPGGNKAFLILANGKRISLTDAKNGSVANQSGINITKTADGKLVYIVKNRETGDSNLSNTIETPVGGQYEVVLPDGTLVTLNTASSITFPTSFESKNERRVSLKGEAYFEVAKNKNQPFKVQTALQEVVVLGTHFNINAYADEDLTQTTLLEGSVRVAATGKKAKLLVPGEQSLINEDQFEVQQVDVESAVAWQNGKFTFENESVEAVMRKIARWYDVEVIYKGDFSKIRLLGSVSRKKKLSEVLRVIQLSRKVKFKVEGRRVTVMP